MQSGKIIDLKKIQAEWGVECVPTEGNLGIGIAELKAAEQLAVG